MRLQNLHTHTHFCDGRNSVEEMIQSAINLGMTSLGFSSHSCLPFPSRWSMKEENPKFYHAEVMHRKKCYQDQISIFLGLEQDYYSGAPTEEYEYIIGSVHYVKKKDHIYAMDRSAETLIEASKESYNGDIYGLIEDYYELVADVARQTNCRIVGHFDLITKHNEGDRVFDTDHPRYIAASMNALEALSKKDLVFEVNTGAMARGLRSAPYPDHRLLRAMRERNLPICISSDAHSAETLLYGFRQAAELARACGYRECMYWNGKEFVPDLLPIW